MSDALPINVFFRNNRTFGVGSIAFDLILSESHDMNNVVSSHPVENGSEITDHIENELLSGSVTGLITNFSVNVEGLSSNRAQDAFDEMGRLWKSRSLVTIVSVMKVYENVAITRVSVARSSSTGEAIALNVSFREVRLVSLKKVNLDVTINVPDMNSDANRQAAPAADVGRTTAKPLSILETRRAALLASVGGS